MASASPEEDERFARLFEECMEQLRRGVPLPEVERQLNERDPQIARSVLRALNAEQALQALKPGSPRTKCEPPARSLGEFCIKRLIGAGGMGQVFEAEYIPLKKKVALKLILPEYRPDDCFRAAFLKEAQLAAGLHHTNIVPVFSFGKEGKDLYYAMDFIRGEGLDRFVKKESAALAGLKKPELKGKQRRWWGEVARIGRQVAQALDHAHTHGQVLHLDIKPSNILVDEAGTALLTDFGMARALGPAHRSVSGLRGWTLIYTAPERLAGKEDTRSDIYSLGLTLHEMLGFKPPFAEAEPAKLERQIREADPPPLRERGWPVPPDLEHVVRKAAAKKSEDRFQTAADLAAELQRFLEGRPLRTRGLRSWASPERLGRWVRHNKATAVLLGLSAVLLVAIGATVGVSFLLLQRAYAQTVQHLAKAREAEGRAWRHASDQIGWRSKSLSALAEAAQIRQTAEQQQEAIAALVRPDLELDPEKDDAKVGTHNVVFDAGLTSYARCDRAGMITVWGVADRRVGLSLHGHAHDKFHVLKFSPDGRYLAASFDPGPQVQVRKLDGESVAVDPGPFSEDAACFSPDSSRLVLGRQDGTIVRYDLASRRIERTWSQFLGAKLHDLAYRPDGKMMAVALTDARKAAAVHFLSARSEERDLPEALPVAPGSRLAWSRDGRILATAGNDSRIVLFDVAYRQRIAVLVGHDYGGIQLSFSPTAELLASVGWDVRLRIWDTRSGRLLLATPALNNPPTFSPDGKRLAFLGIDGRVKLARFEAGEGYRSLQRTPQPATGYYYRSSSVDPNGHLLALGTVAGVELWNLTSGAGPLFSESLGETHSVLFRPTGELLTSGTAGVSLWSVSQGGAMANRRLMSPQSGMPGKDAFFQIAQSRDGRLVAVAGRLQPGRLYAMDPDRPPREIALGPHANARSMAVSPDGALVATGSHTGDGGAQTRIWKSDGTLVTELQGDPLTRVLFSPDGRWFVATGGNCRIWSVGRWDQPRVLGGDAWGLAFSPNSKVLALETGLGMIRLVDPSTGWELALLEDPDHDRANDLTFSPDGARLIATTLDHAAVHVWDLSVLCTGLEKMGLGVAPRFGQPLRDALGIAAQSRTGHALPQPVTHSR